MNYYALLIIGVATAAALVLFDELRHRWNERQKRLSYDKFIDKSLASAQKNQAAFSDPVGYLFGQKLNG